MLLAARASEMETDLYFFRQDADSFFMCASLPFRALQEPAAPLCDTSVYSNYSKNDYEIACVAVTCCM